VSKYKHLSPEMKSRFSDLLCRLSPENLSCDGEISASEANKKHAVILLEWKSFERRLGHRVTEHEVLLDNLLGNNHE